jgi:hypothetical protein
MFDKSTEKDAARRGILGRMELLEEALLRIPDIVNVEFDIRDYPEIPYVILIPKYDIRIDRADYWEARHSQIERIEAVCRQHDLYPTGDRWEDMGEHWYIVRKCGATWPR